MIIIQGKTDENQGLNTLFHQKMNGNRNFPAFFLHVSYFLPIFAIAKRNTTISRQGRTMTPEITSGIIYANLNIESQRQLARQHCHIGSHPDRITSLRRSLLRFATGFRLPILCPHGGDAPIRKEGVDVTGGSQEPVSWNLGRLPLNGEKHVPSLGKLFS